MADALLERVAAAARPSPLAPRSESDIRYTSA
jgi:hypothetical protein